MMRDRRKKRWEGGRDPMTKVRQSSDFPLSPSVWSFGQGKKGERGGEGIDRQRWKGLRHPTAPSLVCFVVEKGYTGLVCMAPDWGWGTCPVSCRSTQDGRRGDDRGDKKLIESLRFVSHPSQHGERT